ncbi:branch migration of Holliday junctions%2C junction-specific DNA helicase%2CATP-dependent DNA helicase%2C recG homolog [Streptococcus pneumoniae]|nr:branch migration of Holliday junctions%2C junction-specific DNA helicase%2CATP-dependent DNA helicase%2C recG homolog [Streptococcus pneumoniae]
MNLHQPLHVLPGVGPKSAEKYAKLGIENLQDLLLYFPFRYEDFKTKQVLELEDGEKAVLSGQVVTPASVQYYGFKRNRLRFSLKQGEVVFAVNFFNQPYLADKIELGATLAVFGKWDRAKASLTGMKVLAQVEDDLQPVYRLAQGISQASLVKVIKTAFDQGLDLLIEENLPQSLLDKYKLMSRCQAVRAMHFPKDLAEYKQALRRIKFEELFYFQMQLQMLKSENRVQGSGLVLNWSQEKVTAVKVSLPFALTQAQEKSLQEILTDMKSDHHMNRLLQGDVGSGKTVVAGLAMFAAVTAGYQAALMVPTEILAEQHFESLQNLFPNLKLALLTGSLKAAEKREVLETIAKGEADLIIGTHALIQDGVEYARLGLIIIDEQHRFGVGQRRILREKGDNPDVLMMTATPEDGEKAVLSGQVVTPASVQYYGFKRNRLRFSLKQGEVVFAVNFFNQPYLADKIELGATLAVFGKWDRAKASLTGMKVLAQVEDDLQPVYRLAQGISQASLVKVIKTAFDQGLDLLIEENLPQSLLDKYKLMSRCQAVRAMHFPKDLAEYKQALRRIKFEELFYFQMQLQTLKSENRVQGSGLVLNWSQEKVTAVKVSLPFALTQAQEKSLQEILTDMKSDHHMNRLLQGDVGSGKTVVAGLAMFAAVTAGYQAALMVPTEILAEQHFESLQNLFPNLKLALLTGSLKAAEKREVLETIAKGEADLIIGTHALIQDGVEYARLGLIIIDEQHRFGVGQRRILREKGDNPDVLMMTATPIPRTLAITAFGDMDVSIIDQMPAGRKPIVTRWIKHEQLPQVLTWLEGEIQKGSQVYVISPLIEESEALDLKNAIALSEELTTHFAGKAEVALLHGRMKSDEKDQIMQDFKERKTDILVSTTVIEVGVNVPNATVMIIMDADRFGLSQLHQLRGRVGRGDKQSYAVLVAIMTETTNGFVLAEEDLKMRGSGEIFGTRQSGLPEFQVADIIEDFPILEEARKVASYISSIEAWQEDPEWRMIALHLEKKEHLD